MILVVSMLALIGICVLPIFVPAAGVVTPFIVIIPGVVFGSALAKYMNNVR